MSRPETMGEAYARHSREARRHRHAAHLLECEADRHRGQRYWELRYRAKHHETQADYHDGVFN